ncbi:MAG: hypothetical protein ABSA76_05605 [Bacteroidales bacterium]
MTRGRLKSGKGDSSLSLGMTLPIGVAGKGKAIRLGESPSLSLQQYRAVIPNESRKAGEMRNLNYFELFLKIIKFLVA